jgi:hypothetical protein
MGEVYGILFWRKVYVGKDDSGGGGMFHDLRAPTGNIASVESFPWLETKNLQ